MKETPGLFMLGSVFVTANAVRIRRKWLAKDGSQAVDECASIARANLPSCSVMKLVGLCCPKGDSWNPSSSYENFRVNTSSLSQRLEQ